MTNIDVLQMAVKNLLKRKLRTVLTALGVIVGALCIIIVISISIGLNRNMEAQMDNFGDITVIQIYNWSAFSGYDKNNTVLTDEIIDEIMAMPGVEVATPVMDMYFYMKSGRFVNQIMMRGMRTDAMEAMGYRAAEGRLLTPDDTLAIVFSQSAVESFYNPNDRRNSRPGYGGGMMFGMKGGGIIIDGGMGVSVEEERPKPNVDVFNDRMTMSFDYMYTQPNDPNYTPDVRPPRAYTVTGAGILGESTNWELSYYSVMNIDEMKKIRIEYDQWQRAQSGGAGGQQTHGYERAMVKCTNANSVRAVSEKIQASHSFDYVYTPTEWIDQVKDTMQSLQITLGILGAVSLLIATIGIANTMFASVYERTREIGVMKVIGATVRDVRRLFLLESAIIGLVGGTIGIILSLAVSFILNNIGIQFFTQMVMFGSDGGQLSYIPGWLCLLSFGITALIGLVSGYFPARHATRLSALTAIRME